MKIILSTFTLLFCGLTSFAQQIESQPLALSQFSGNSTSRVVVTDAFTSDTDLGPNQQYVGYYTTNTVTTADRGYGWPAYYGLNMLGSIFSGDLLERYRGYKVVGFRIGTAQALEETQVYIKSVNADGLPSDDNIFTTKIDIQNDASWNVVKLPAEQQFYIPESGDIKYFVGFKYIQGQNSNLMQSYPISLVENKEYRSTFMLYVQKTKDEYTWIKIGENSTLHPSIQLILEGTSVPEYDIAVKSVTSSKKYNKWGDKMDYTIATKNYGSKAVNYTLKGYINGEHIPSLDVKRDTLVRSNAVDTIRGMVTLPVREETGTMDITWKVDKLNGTIDDPILSNNETSYKSMFYVSAAPRQKQLIEHFTSQSCTVCPIGISFLEYLITLRKDIAWVSIHGDESEPDIFKIDKGESIAQYERVGGFPKVSFNRFYIEELDWQDNKRVTYTLAYNVAYTGATNEQVGPFLSSVVDSSAYSPSFVKIQIPQKYDPATRKLTFSVIGEGVKGASELLKDNAVYVYITEDGKIAKQLKLGEWINDFRHDNVLREVLTSVNGDLIEWNGDNFTKEFTYEIPKEYVANNMHIVAFVAHQAFNNTHPSRIAVNNCERVKIEDPTAITTPDIQDNPTVEAIYTTAGQRVNTFVKGINIVKLSNGKTFKVNIP